MSDLFDTSSVRDDSEHWDALAENVAAHAARKPDAIGFDWLAHSRAGWISASLVLAAALLSMLPSPQKSSARSGRVNWPQAFAPADDVGREIISPDGPPPVGALLIGGRGGA